MKWRRAALLLLLSVTATVWTAVAGPAPAPLLFVRVSGPAGMTARFFEGGVVRRTLDAPVLVGLRPGMVYRLQLDHLPQHPGVTLFPSLEVRGTLRLPPSLKASDYPAPVFFTDEDIERAIAGTFLTKIYVLEDPEKSLDLTPPADQPVQLEVTPDRDPLDFAKDIGRPVLIVRLGRKEPDPVELARVRPGMILYPGELALPPAAGVRLPVPGQEHLTPLPLDYGGPPKEECLRDGGDRGLPVHLTPGGQLRGLDPADSVAEYTDTRGRRQLVITCPVCVCAPRYVVVKHLQPLAAYEATRELFQMNGSQERGQLNTRQPSGKVRQVEETVALKGRQSLSANRTVQGTLRLISMETLRANEVVVGPAVALTGKEATQEAVFFMVPKDPCCPEQPGPLQVSKRASTVGAKIGEVVTFYLQYTNIGKAPLRDVALADSLTGRLEYLPGTAQSDREAVFVTQTNESGSLLLRWEVRDPLPPGQRGTVSFQARVR